MNSNPTGEVRPQSHKYVPNQARGGLALARERRGAPSVAFTGLRGLPNAHNSSILAILLALFLAACQTPTPIAPTPVAKADIDLRSEMIQEADGLVVDLDFTPDGRLFYILRDGAVYLLDLTTPNAAPVEFLTLDVSTRTSAESGLLGLAVSPTFEQDHHVYMHYIPADADGNPEPGRVVRYTEQGASPIDPFTILDTLPNRADQLYHFGGGLSFGPDGKLYLIFGDTNLPAEAQNPDSWYGSVLRFNPDGSLPDDNPFADSPVYAHGIRNGFGLAWSPETGLLYETENGERCDDELNLIEPGTNLGWGVHEYNTCPYPDNHAIAPLYEWTPTSAPAGILFYTGDLIPEWKNDLLLCGFNRRELYHFELTSDGRAVESVEIIHVPDMGYTCRVALAQGPDGWVYFSTETGVYRLGR